MAHEQKTYPPSESRLATLRSEGQIPFSLDVVSAGVLCGLIAALFFAAQCFSADCAFEPFSRYAVEAFRNSGHSEANEMAQAFDRVWILTRDFTGPIILGVLVFSLFQTRFLFTLRPLRFQVGRVFALTDRGRGRGGLLLSIVLFGKGILWILLVVLLLGSIFRSGALLGETSTDIADTLALAQGQWRVVLTVTVFFLGIIAILSRIIRVQSFLHEHRMTLEEVEAELREAELAPAMRRALREAGQKEMSED